jgi:hypothetical protein
MELPLTSGRNPGIRAEKTSARLPLAGLVEPAWRRTIHLEKGELPALQVVKHSWII